MFKAIRWFTKVITNVIMAMFLRCVDIARQRFSLHTALDCKKIAIITKNTQLRIALSITFKHEIKCKYLPLVNI